eukprot:scaffold46916_cov55-Attheya_sp.AAC.1
MPPSQADQWWLDAQRVDKLATLDPRLSSMRMSRDKRRRSRPHSAIAIAATGTGRSTGRPAATAAARPSRVSPRRKRRTATSLRART